MRIIPFVITILLLAWAAWSRDWFNLASSTSLTLLIVGDSIVSAMREASSKTKA